MFSPGLYDMISPGETAWEMSESGWKLEWEKSLVEAIFELGTSWDPGAPRRFL